MKLVPALLLASALFAGCAEPLPGIWSTDYDRLVLRDQGRDYFVTPGYGVAEDWYPDYDDCEPGSGFFFVSGYRDDFFDCTRYSPARWYAPWRPPTCERVATVWHSRSIRRPKTTGKRPYPDYERFRGDPARYVSTGIGRRPADSGNGFMPETRSGRDSRRDRTATTTAPRRDPAARSAAPDRNRRTTENRYVPPSRPSAPVRQPEASRHYSPAPRESRNDYSRHEAPSRRDSDDRKNRSDSRNDGNRDRRR